MDNNNQGRKEKVENLYVVWMNVLKHTWNTSSHSKDNVKTHNLKL